MSSWVNSVHMLLEHYAQEYEYLWKGNVVYSVFIIM